MRHKEAAVLTLKLERWYEDDRAELCYRALHRVWADIRRGMPGQILQEMTMAV